MSAGRWLRAWWHSGTEPKRPPRPPRSSSLLLDSREVTNFKIWSPEAQPHMIKLPAAWVCAPLLKKLECSYGRRLLGGGFALGGLEDRPWLDLIQISLPTFPLKEEEPMASTALNLPPTSWDGVSGRDGRAGHY